jgi:hypothetical protein
MPKRFITIVSIGPTDIVLWIEDRKYDYVADQFVIKHFLYLQRHNQGKAIDYLRDHCDRYWDITDETGPLDKKAWRIRELKVGDRIQIKPEFQSQENDADNFQLGYSGADGWGFSQIFTIMRIDMDEPYMWGKRFRNSPGTIYTNRYKFPYTNWREIMDIVNE